MIKKVLRFPKNQNYPEFSDHEESTSTTKLTIENGSKTQEGRDSEESPRKVHNGSTSSSKIWSIADTLNEHKEEKRAEKNLDTSGSSLSSASASTSVTSPPVSAATSSALTLALNATPLDISKPNGILIPPGKGRKSEKFRA